MLKVLGRITSINVRKVLWTCCELGLTYEHEAWGSGELRLDSPQFRSLNPNGLVPVIVEDDFVLWESNAICRYLAAAHRREDLLPSDAGLPSAARARARIEQWMEWQLTELNNAYVYAFLGLVRRSPANQDAAQISASIANWNCHMTLVEAQLQKSGGFIAGATFSIADVPLGLSVHRWYLSPIERPDLPAVADYYRKLTARPAFAAHGSIGVP